MSGGLDQLRVLVVEDEDLAARRLLRLLGGILGDRARSPRRVPTLWDALDSLREDPIDLLFLDLDLAGEDGFALLREAAAGSFDTIVVSAHAERAIEAFEHGVLDFVPKPYSRERLERAVERAVGAERRQGPGAAALAVRKPGRVELLPVADIAWLQGAGDYVEVVLADGGRHLHDKTLDRLERLLPERFVRVHRSYLLDLDRVRACHSYAGGRHEAVLADGAVIPISRSRIGRLRERLGLSD